MSRARARRAGSLAPCALLGPSWSLLLALLLLAHPAAAPRAETSDTGAASAPGAVADTDEDEEGEEEEDLRQRLTEREDKRRPVEPWSTLIAGHPLSLEGEWELELSHLRRQVWGDGAERRDRLLLEQNLEVEAFYSLGPPLSLFVQLRGVMEEDLISDSLDDVSELFVERGEMWLFSEDIGGTPLNVDVGRLHFEDERRWWWDDELDALRVAWETETLELSLALARELAPERLDRSEVDPEQERVLRWIGELSWDWAPHHSFELFLLHQSDASPRESPGQRVAAEAEDESDARLTWLGARLLGVAPLGAAGILGYWLDTGVVHGRERLLGFEDNGVERARRRDVRGWGVDAGLSWILPWVADPRLFVALAVGSGERAPEQGADRSFRQSGLQANEAGFGGVERFGHYGVLLDPELSNLVIPVLGAGISLLRSSSLDLVYHHYRMFEPATELRGARLEAVLGGEQRDLGHALDLVLALEEWERLEFLFIASAFRAGRAFGEERGRWSAGSLFAMRIAF